MGTWGTGNLENDGAQDELANICDQLFNKLIALLQHPQAHQYEDEEIDQLFVLIEMIFALHDRNMITVSPPLERLDPLLRAYLERWDRYCREVGNGSWPERQAVIEATFDKLRLIVDGSAEDGLSHRLELIAGKMSKPEEDHVLRKFRSTKRRDRRAQVFDLPSAAARGK